MFKKKSIIITHVCHNKRAADTEIEIMRKDEAEHGSDSMNLNIQSFPAVQNHKSSYYNSYNTQDRT